MYPMREKKSKGTSELWCSYTEYIMHRCTHWIQLVCGIVHRLDYRMEWDKALREYLKKLDSTKPLIYCGDLNVAHNPIGTYVPSVLE